MSWKPKEKELTPEEAVALAKKELAPYWLGSPPFFAGVVSEGKASVFPLNPDFSKKVWLMFFVDPSWVDSKDTLFKAIEWHNRYGDHNLEFLVIYFPCYEFYKNSVPLVRLREKEQIEFPFTIDVEGAVSAAFGVKKFPKVLLYEKGAVAFEGEGKNWMKGFELKIQQFLRIADPGLPLLTPVDSDIAPEAAESSTEKSVAVEFGFQPKSGTKARFVNGTFVVPEVVKSDVPGQKSAKSSKVPEDVEAIVKTGSFASSSNLKLETALDISLTGNWSQDEEKIFTSDPKAMLEFIGSSSLVSVVAQAIGKSGIEGMITIEMNDQVVDELYIGESLTMDEQGRSILKITQPQAYVALRGMSSDLGAKITFKFPTAHLTAIGIFGLRI